MSSIGDKIANEDDPFMRVIMALGYFHLSISWPDYTITFFNDKDQKKFDIYEFQQVIFSLTVKTAILWNGKKHMWVADADGSADRFRNYILNGKGN